QSWRTATTQRRSGGGARFYSRDPKLDFALAQSLTIVTLTRLPRGTRAMSLFDVAGDAERAFAVLKRGGTAIVPHSIGYAALGGSAAALRRIFEAKRR